MGKAGERRSAGSDAGKREYRKQNSEGIKIISDSIGSAEDTGKRANQLPPT
jgi:hypothetical protein